MTKPMAAVRWVVAVVVIGTMGADEGVLVSPAGSDQFCGVPVVAATALDGVKVG